MISFRDFMQRKVWEYYSLRRVGHDFFTAPELDRAFGYALADFLIPYLKGFEKPTLLELGAGTGSLANDILSYTKDREPKLFSKLSYLIYDFSPTLIALQRKRLSPFVERVSWVEDIPYMQGCVVANEFFDCLPVHVVKDGRELYLDGRRYVWKSLEREDIREFIRRMGYDGFEGVVEVCLDCLAFLRELAQRVKGYLLIIDYGYTSEEMGRFSQGTVVGYRSHRLVKDPLEEEGPFDLTAHVNFSALMEYGRDYGLTTLSLKGLTEFLTSSEAFLRELESLSSREDPDAIERLSRLKTMLLSMGPRFKVLFQSNLSSNS